MAWQNSTKCMWNDKFHAPSVAQLREGYPKAVVGVFDAAREGLTALQGVSQAVAWHGVPWRWTLVYRCAEESHAVTRAFAYIVPDPTRLQLCVPLDKAQIAALPMRRFKKNIRDTIVHARSVSGVCWPSWDVPTRQALDDVLDVVQRKHALITSDEASVTLSA